jgi:hypothetical protein
MLVWGRVSGGIPPRALLCWGRSPWTIGRTTMRTRTLTHEQHVMLQLIAEGPLRAIPEVARYTTPLAEARLIELTPEEQWRVTRLGEAMLEPRGRWLH